MRKQKLYFGKVLIWLALTIVWLSACAPLQLPTPLPQPSVTATEVIESTPTALVVSASSSPSASPSATNTLVVQTSDAPTDTPSAPSEAPTASSSPPASTTPIPTRTLTPLPPPTLASPPGVGGSAVGFIFLGSKDDWGYNQAAYNGSLAVEQKFAGTLTVLRAENVAPEDAARVMEEMIGDGARILFLTAYDYLDPALPVARRHPEVAFLHQGGASIASNLGSYSGNMWEAMYLSGIVAGKLTTNNRLGFVAAFPIPQVLLNINAFTLGARSVNPQAMTYARFTQSWCDPQGQQEATFALLDVGVSVMAQHQDCTRTVIEWSERNAVMSIGYNVEAASLAPKRWLTGAVWKWETLYPEMVEAINAGHWNAGPYNGKYRAGLKDGLIDLAPFGASVPAEVKTLVQQKKQAIINGQLYPFEGSIKDQSGVVRISAGARPAVEELEGMDYLVEGVVGEIP
jgi:basic membrane protein A and related proteins